MTLEQLRIQLSAIEPDDSTYAGIGPDEIPLLAQLLQDSERWLAARAVFALSRVRDPRAVALLVRSAADPREELRVATAASARSLPAGEANAILAALLRDADLGVRKFAVASVSDAHDASVQAALRDLESGDAAPAIREAARVKLLEIRRQP